MRWELTCGFCRLRFRSATWYARSYIACPQCGTRNLLDGAPKDDGWAPIGSITHDGRTARFIASSFEDDGTVVLFTERGLGEGRGDWSITFDELVGNERLAGPWILKFDGA